MEQIVQKAAIGAAALVGAKYLDAKFDLIHDFKLVKANIATRLRCGYSLACCANYIRARRMLKTDRCNFYFLFEDAVNAVPDKVFLWYQGKEWTYRESNLQIFRFANYFLSIGVNSKGSKPSLKF
jgi:hypothetical protein